MKFSRTKTSINNRLESKIKEKSPENTSKINTIKLINKVLMVPTKPKIEESKAKIDSSSTSQVKPFEMLPIKENITESKSQDSEAIGNTTAQEQTSPLDKK